MLLFLSLSVAILGGTGWWEGPFSLEGQVDLVGPPTSTYRVYRGGCLDRDACDCRSASRAAYYSDYRYRTHGFRILAVPNGVSQGGKGS